MVDNHRKPSLPMVAWPKNHRKTIVSNGWNQPLENLWWKWCPEKVILPSYRWKKMTIVQGYCGGLSCLAQSIKSWWEKLGQPTRGAEYVSACQHCCQALFWPGTFTWFTRFLHDLRVFTWFFAQFYMIFKQFFARHKFYAARPAPLQPTLSNPKKNLLFYSWLEILLFYSWLVSFQCGEEEMQKQEWIDMAVTAKMQVTLLTLA